jgi:hypothetical protein
MITRASVVRTAREYIGTPFSHQGRLKGYACDCVGLVLMVADEIGLFDVHGKPMRKHDYINYCEQPMDGFVHEECVRRLIGKPVSEMKEGDVLTLRVPSIPCHVAIVSTVNGLPGMIHAYSSFNKVVENIIDDKWLRRVEGCFSIPGVG